MPALYYISAVNEKGEKDRRFLAITSKEALIKFVENATSSTHASGFAGRTTTDHVAQRTGERLLTGTELEELGMDSDSTVSIDTFTKPKKINEPVPEDKLCAYMVYRACEYNVDTMDLATLRKPIVPGKSLRFRDGCKYPLPEDKLLAFEPDALGNPRTAQAFKMNIGSDGVYFYPVHCDCNEDYHRTMVVVPFRT